MCPCTVAIFLYVPDDRFKEVMLQAIALAVAMGSSVAIYRIAYQ